MESLFGIILVLFFNLVTCSDFESNCRTTASKEYLRKTQIPKCTSSDECVNGVCQYYGGCQCNSDYAINPKTGLCTADFNECICTKNNKTEHNCFGLHQVCVNLDAAKGKKFKCGCESGWSDSNSTCNDVNECLEINKCPENSNCQNTPGSYNCTCTKGFTMIKGYCEDINECKKENQCEKNKVCVNIPGSFLCKCEQGYIEENGACVDINECTSNITDTSECLNCSNTIGSYKCHECTKGFTIINNTCRNINECLTENPCNRREFCKDTHGSYQCGCFGEYAGEYPYCRTDAPIISFINYWIDPAFLQSSHYPMNISIFTILYFLVNQLFV